MTTHTSQIVLNASSPTNHYNWIAAFSAALAAIGLVQSADTGQVVLAGQTTVALPASALGANTQGIHYSSPAVFQIWEMAAAGLPTIYFRFDYGVMVNANNGNAINQLNYNYPAITYTCGPGTDGAGNLTRFQSSGGRASHTSMQQVNGWSGSSAQGSQMPSLTAQECDFASDGQHYLSIMMGENAPSYESLGLFSMGVERTLDPTTGVYDGAGLVSVSAMTGGQTWYYIDIANHLEWSGSGGLPSLAPPFNIAVVGTQIYLFPLVGSCLIPKGSPLLGFAYYTTNIDAPVSFPATQYGTAHTYKACPRSSTSADAFATGTKLALRFD